MVMHAKQYIHTQTINTKVLNVKQFNNFYRQAILIEKEIYTEKDYMKAFIDRFSKTLLSDLCIIYTPTLP